MVRGVCPRTSSSEKNDAARAAGAFGRNFTVTPWFVFSFVFVRIFNFWAALSLPSALIDLFSHLGQNMFRGRTNQSQTWCPQRLLVFFSNFILSRTDHVPVRDKIKFEKHGLSIAAWLVKMTPTAASEMYKSCTDIAGSAKIMAAGPWAISKCRNR